MKKSKTPKTAKITTPQYEAACKDYAARAAKVAKLEGQQKEDEQKVKEKYAAKLAPEKEAMDKAFDTIQKYCEENREEIFADAKSIDTGYGITVGFRTGQKKLEYGDGVKAEDLLAVLKRKGLVQYIATKESVDAGAIIKAEDDKKLGNALEGVGCSVVQNESFYIK